MAVHGEAVLRARLCVSRACSALFFICSHCDRGQRYCSTVCSSDARRRQHRAANQRYQSSPEGRLDHRDRQCQYRQRQATRQPCVTDQGSQTVISPAPSGCGEAIAKPVAVAALRLAPLRLCCCRCGRPGRFVDPFPSIPPTR